MPIKPDRLGRGDLIGIVAPASAPPVPKAVERAVETLTAAGFRVRHGPNVRKRLGFLAGSDRERAADLMGMFQDRRVKAILCVRGGYGSSRLLPLLDFHIIRANPKIFLGYSDVTSLHCAFLRKANLVSFHGPMLVPDFANGERPRFGWQSCQRALMHPSPAGSICRDYHRKTIIVLRGGKASGQLVGGNLSVLCTTLGTPFQPSFKNRILFLEDHSEAPYRFDRMLTHLLNAGVLRQVAGVAVGTNESCHDPIARKSREYRQTLEDVLRERLLPLKVPVVAGLPFGNVPLNATVPLGVQATLDGIKGDLEIVEAAVK
jgi:muramoyltetrapeptide carboxypeptidase